MTVKTIIAAIVLSLSAAPVALAQSDYTTGTAASNEAAGYPSPGGYGGGLYAYMPNYKSGYTAGAHHWRGWSRFRR